VPDTTKAQPLFLPLPQTLLNHTFQSMDLNLQSKLALELDLTSNNCYFL